MTPSDSTQYVASTLTRAEVDGWAGIAVLDFGTDWCGICQAARPRIEAALDRCAPVRHVRIEDGPGRPLGRSFKVKLWPTLVVLKDGAEVARVVRPMDADTVVQVLREVQS